MHTPSSIILLVIIINYYSHLIILASNMHITSTTRIIYESYYA